MRKRWRKISNEQIMEQIVHVTKSKTYTLKDVYHEANLHIIGEQPTLPIRIIRQVLGSNKFHEYRSNGLIGTTLYKLPLTKEQEKEEYNLYMKKQRKIYYEFNKDKVKERCKKYYLKNKERMKKQFRDYYYKKKVMQNENKI